MDTNELFSASLLPNSITKYLQQQLKAPTQFGQAQQAQQTQYQHPMLGIGPNGSWLDPSQASRVDQTAYLGERGDIASQDIQNKMGYANDLVQSSNSFANLQNAIPFLNAKNISNGSSGGGLFGSLGL